MSIIPRDRSNDTYYWHRAAVDYRLALMKHNESLLEEPKNRYLILFGGIQPGTELDFKHLGLTNVKVVNNTPVKLIYAVWKKESVIEIGIANCNFAKPSQMLSLAALQKKTLFVHPAFSPAFLDDAVKEKYKEAGILNEKTMDTLCRAGFVLEAK